MKNKNGNELRIYFAVTSFKSICPLKKEIDRRIGLDDLVTLLSLQF